jgi:uncharacterized repeat protein (TIGR03803 family)
MAIAPHWLSDNPWRTLCLACALAATGALPAPAQSASEVVLHSFSPNPYKGEYPQAGVIRDAAGNLYGTTSAGGPMGAGVVYKVDTAGNYSVLYAFTGGADGSVPAAGVVRDPAGNLYGTTLRGGGPNFGVIFKVDPAGQETVLYTFPNGGGSPSSGVILDSAGNLYGTASTGDGSVYKLDPAGKFTVLYGFTGGAGGNSPSGVILDPAGNLYGAAFGGTANWGVVYMLDASKRYKETVLHTFTGGTDGSYPNGLIRDSSGNLYGTTASGGIAGTGAGYGAGVVYKLDAAGEQTVLYSFTGGADGCYPGSPVALDAAGNLYGTTGGGGAAAGLAGWGVVFEVDTAGQETVLHTFSGGTDGGIPEAGVILTAAGNFYGTTYQGGAQGVGTVYKLNGDGKETVLYSFSAAADGGNPMSGLSRDAAGNFYGTTYFGGAANYGGVYKLDTKGNETLLYSFTGEADGGFPAAGVALDSAGNLYGTTSHGGAAGYGVVFKLNTAGQETVLYSFTGGADGGGPQAGVIRDSEGNLYGTTVSGGETGICIPSGCGVVYQVDTAGNETVLYSFADGARWRFPPTLPCGASWRASLVPVKRARAGGSRRPAALPDRRSNPSDRPSACQTRAHTTRS